MMTIRALLAAFLALVSWPALADFAFTAGSGQTMFTFTCFTSKHCYPQVPINSSGTEIFTTSNPANVVTYGMKDSGGTDMTDTTNHALKVVGVGVGDNVAYTSQTGSPVQGYAETSPTALTSGRLGFLSLIPGTRAVRSDMASLGGTAVDTNSGNKSAGTLRSVLATDQLALATWGHGTSGASVPSGLGFVGGRAQNAEQTAVTNGQGVGLAADLVGKLVTSPHANPENFLNGVPTAAITDTTSTQVLASAGASTRNYLTWCAVQNSHASVGTFVQILDGSTVIDSGWAGPNGGGFGRRYPTPQRGTAATAVNCQATTTGANFKCVCGGFKGT